MASPKFYTVAKDYLTCPLCAELFKAPNYPKLLDCHHMCCEVCITKSIEGGKQTIECPDCNHVTPIPKDGANAMKTNVMVRSLAEVALTEDEPMCSDHNELIQHYCQKCNAVACSTCVVHEHTGRSHDVREVCHAHQEQMEDLGKAIKQADSEVSESKRSIQQLESVEKEITDLLKLQEDNIDKHIDMVVAIIKDRAQTLKLQIRETEEKRIDDVKREITRLQKQVEEMKQTRDDVRKAMDNTRKHEYVVKHAEHVKSMGKKLDSDTSMGSVCKNPVIGMTKCGFEGPFSISIKMNGPVQVKRYHLELVTEFGNFEDACAIVAIPNGSLLVCDSEDAKMYIYSQQKDGHYKRKVSLSLSSKNTTKLPRGIAMTAEGKILVARWKHVEVYSQSGKYEGVLNLTRDTGKTVGKGTEYVEALDLKVISDGRIIVSDLKEQNIFIISPKGEIVRSVRTSIDPWRMAVMPHGHIAVSDFGNGKVCVIDLKTGQEIRNFHAFNATGLCYHGDFECILVGRCLQVGEDGGVIEQYCSPTGRLVACVAEDLCRPEDMTFTQDGMLAVADTKTVKIFKVT